MKFKYDCFNNRLSRLEGEYAYEVSEEKSFIGSYGERGFVLDTNNPNHWISFTVYDQVIRVFYKRVSKVNGDNVITYYQKDVPKEVVIEFELTEKDIVAKRDDGKWVKKG
jgi:hypothetical protein